MMLCCCYSQAVSSILLSKTFDNGVICASEQSMVVMDKVYDKVCIGNAVSLCMVQQCYALVCWCHIKELVQLTSSLALKNSVGHTHNSSNETVLVCEGPANRGVLGREQEMCCDSTQKGHHA